MKFLLNLFSTQNQTSNQTSNQELSLDEKNRIREARETLDRKLERDRSNRESLLKDKEYHDMVMDGYPSWLEEFQYQVHKGACDSKFRFEGGEIVGVVGLGDYTFNLKTRLGDVSRNLTGVKVYVNITNQYLLSDLNYSANMIRNTSLVSISTPVDFALKVIEELKKEKAKIHQNRVLADRAERKRLKREMLERNRQRNLARKKAST
tara:strand:- start:22 stop:642 length:621 start_codon:yes stop_codon:yes gene_type:complete